MKAEARACQFIFLGQGLLQIRLLFQLGWQASEVLGYTHLYPTPHPQCWGHMLGFL